MNRNAPVAQLDRALPSEGKGHTFESCRVRQNIKCLGSISQIRASVNLTKRSPKLIQRWRRICDVHGRSSYESLARPSESFGQGIDCRSPAGLEPARAAGTRLDSGPEIAIILPRAREGPTI